MFSGTLVITYKTIGNHDAEDHIPSLYRCNESLKVLFVFFPHSSFILIPLKTAGSKKTKPKKKSIRSVLMWCRSEWNL